MKNIRNILFIQKRADVQDKMSRNPVDISFRVAGIYIFLGSLWILISDVFMITLVGGSKTISYISIIKGLIYVIVSGLVIYRLVFSSVRRIKESENTILENYNELKTVYDELAESKEFNSLVIEKMMNAFALHKIILDKAGNPCDYEYVTVNKSFEDFVGMKREDILGKRYKEVVPNTENETTDWIGVYSKVALTGTPISFEEYTSAFHKWVIVNAYSPKYGYFVTIFSDITAMKMKENELRDKNEEVSTLYEELLASEEELRRQYAKLESTYAELYVTQKELKKQYSELKKYQNKAHYDAYHDSLTGLPNRRELIEKMEAKMKWMPEQQKAMLFVDLDNFKLINDTMGHFFGDRLLVCIAERLSSLLDYEQSVYRLGGDEFIIYYYGLKERNEIEQLAVRIIQSFHEPFVVDESILYVTVSIGISLSPEHGRSPEEMLQNADIAMYKAKTTGKDRYVFYDEKMKKMITERMVIEKHMHNALENKEFLLHYQPQLDIEANQVTGFEALIRWNNPELGFLSPLQFIGIAEENRLIIPIGDWVLKEACAFMAELHRKGYKELTIAVNISITQIMQEDFVEKLLSILNESGLEPQFIELEITESVLMQSYQEVTEKLCRLRNVGVKIALDDFGQGYSSLTYLKMLPIHTLKIDKSFIDGVRGEHSQDNLTSSIVLIGLQMGLTILAEGVEYEEQREYLKQHGCQKIQGYLVSKPLPQNDAVQFYQQYHTRNS